MSGPLAIHFDVGFGLAFDIEESATTSSGFRPAEKHFGSNNPQALFGDLRLKGFAAALETGFIGKLCLAGKDEKRYPNKNLNQAWAIRQMLVEDYGADPERIEWRASTSNTAGSLTILTEWMQDMRSSVDSSLPFVILTNHYHEARASFMYLLATGESVPVCPAEMLLFAAAHSAEEHDALEQNLCARFTDGLPGRVAQEIRGMGVLLCGSYVAQMKGWA